MDEARSLLAESKAQTQQAEARIKSMQGEREAASAAVKQAESDVGRLVAARSLAEKQLARVKELAERRAVDQRLVDEHQRELDGAVAGEQTAGLAVLTAKASWLPRMPRSTRPAPTPPKPGRPSVSPNLAWRRLRSISITRGSSPRLMGS